MSRAWLFIVVAILGAAGGAMFSLWRSADALDAEQAEAQEMVGQRRPDYTLGATDGRRISASDFDGDVVLVNFWATWCAPCRKEMPLLKEVQGRYAGQGFNVVGIALDDVGRAREFVEELGIDYTILVGAADVMSTGVMYGNRKGLLPYSVLVDREGIIRWTLLGELEEDELIHQLEGLL